MDIDRSLLSTLEYRYGAITFPRNDSAIGLSLTTFGEWAQAELDLLLTLVGPGNTVVDVGANIGTHTLAFCERVGPTGSVHAIEPHPVLYQILAENTRQNGISNATLLNLALSDAIGLLRLTDVDLTRPGNFGHTFAIDGAEDSITQTVEVPTTTLDSLALEACDLLKIDVEGMESKVLKGATDILRSMRPTVYAECLTLDGGWDVHQVLHGSGYVLWLHRARSDNPNNWYGSTQRVFGLAHEANLLAVPDEKVSEYEQRLSKDPSMVPILTLDDLARALFDTPRYLAEPGDLENLSRPGLLARIVRLHEHIARLEQQRSEDQQQIARLDQQIARLEQQRIADRQQIARLEQRSSEDRQQYERGLAEQRQATEAEARLRSEIAAELNEVTRLTSDLEAEIRSYSSSTSWQLTAPLRVVGGLGRSLRSRTSRRT